MLTKKSSYNVQLFVLFCLLILITSCKKNRDIDSSTNEIQNSEVPQSVKDAWKAEGYSVTYLLDKKIAAIFVDENGNERKLISSKLLATCDAEDEDFVNNEFYMQAQQVGYACESGHVEIRYRNVVLDTPITGCSDLDIRSDGWVYTTVNVQ